ncbi:midasin-like [Helianthus annuus]|uniref:midasin-like n=1 Tax=Helianthus annuus TaxID=4232 RepID=UPI000B8FC0D1|nr:midasin-like [Helianthus annuus]
MDVHAAFNEIEVKRAEERRSERERRLAEEATQKNKSVIEDIQEAGGSSSQPEIDGSSNQEDIEMVEAENEQEVDVQEQHVVEIQEQVMEDVTDEQGQDFMMIGESSEPFDVNNILQRVVVIQRKRKAREVLLLEWKTQQFVLVGDARLVPYSVKEIARRMKIKERQRKAKIARGEIVDDDSDIELFGNEEEEDEDDNDDKKDDKPDDTKNKDDKGDDDNDQGASGLLIRDPILQERIDELMNDEINEQEDDLQNEASSSGKQHADQVLLSNPTVIYLNVQQEGEVEVRRTRAEMLEELGLEDGKFKFDIEDEIPQSPEKDFEPRYAYEADHYDDVIIEDASDSSDDEIDFHYAGIDATFPSLAEMFKDRNEDEIKRKIVEKVSTEDVPETIPREILAEERKKWFKVMPKERKTLRALQYFTHNKNLSWGDILSWGYLEDLKVYAIRREEGVQYFEFLSDISSLPLWDVDELVKTKNIKQFYYGPEVRQHDQDLWNYIKWQEKNGYPD